MNIVRQNRTRPFIFGLAVSLPTFYLLHTLFTTIPKGPRHEDLWMWSGGVVLGIILGWIMFATMLRCFHCAFYPRYYIYVDKEGLSLCLPLGTTFALFRPFYKTLEKKIPWGELLYCQEKLDEDGGIFSEISLLIATSEKEYPCKVLPLRESHYTILLYLEAAQDYFTNTSSEKSTPEFKDIIQTTEPIPVSTYLYFWIIIVVFTLLLLTIYTAKKNPFSLLPVLFITPAILIVLAMQALSFPDIGLPEKHVIWRILTFISGGILPLAIIFGKNILPESLITFLIPFCMLFVWGCPAVLAKLLGRRASLWVLLAIVTSGISNLVLSIQEKK